MRLGYYTIGATCSVVGLVAGAISAIYLSGLGTLKNPLGEQIFLNNWVSNWTIGTKASDPYTTAWVARYGLLALRRSEAVYFIKNRDDDGDRLTEECEYRLSGGALPAQWWSFTVYDPEGFLPLNDDGHLSFDATEVRAGQSWSVVLSSDPPADSSENWVSTKAGGRFDVTMRLYLPDTAFIETPMDHMVPPTITKIGCKQNA
jgi:hypothetical protein